MRPYWPLWALRRGSQSNTLLLLPWIDENQKGTGGRGREKIRHDNLRQTSRQFIGNPKCHRVLEGAPPRGRQLYFTFPSAPDPLFRTLKAPFLTLRVATPSGAPRQAPLENVGAGACGIWGRREEVQRLLHEAMRLAEARLVRHVPGGNMPS